MLLILAFTFISTLPFTFFVLTETVGGYVPHTRGAFVYYFPFLPQQNHISKNLRVAKENLLFW